MLITITLEVVALPFRIRVLGRWFCVVVAKRLLLNVQVSASADNLEKLLRFRPQVLRHAVASSDMVICNMFVM